MGSKNLKDLNLNVDAKDGAVSVEICEKKHVLNIEVFNTPCYETMSPKDFIRHLDQTYGDDYRIYYNTTAAQAYHSDMSKDVSRYEIAKLSLNHTNRLKNLYNIYNTWCSLEEFKTFLKSMRGFMDINGVKLLDKLDDFQINRVTNVVRSKDTHGNYNYAFSRKSGKGDVKFPEKIEFTLRPFELLGEVLVIKFDFEFDFHTRDEKILLQFKITNYEFDEVIVEESKKVLDNYLPEDKRFFGKMEIGLLKMSDKFSVLGDESRGF